MKHTMITLLSMILLTETVFAEPTTRDDIAAELSKSIKHYFDTCFADLKTVADKAPTPDTFRDAMAPVAEKTEGFFGGTLIDTNCVIQQVYFKRNFLARGFDLNKVKQLERFWKKMHEKPEPQLSEPARGNIMQPRLVAMRYPVVRNGELLNIVSMMVRTEAFLKETGLDKRPAFSIVCDGIQSEKEGELSKACHRLTLALPSTQWVIQFD